MFVAFRPFFARQVCDLAEKVYRLAEILVTPAVQLELCTKFDEPFITPKIFMDYFNQMDALDKFVFQPESHPAFDIAIRMENYAGAQTNKLARGSSSSGVVSVGRSVCRTSNSNSDPGSKVCVLCGQRCL